MKHLLFVLFILSSIPSVAQFDSGNNALNIPPVDNPSAPAPKLSVPKKDPYYVPPSITGEPSGNRGLTIENSNPFPGTKPKFVNPGKEIEDKLNKRGDGEMYQVLRKNQYLGDFRTKSGIAKLSYRDHEYVDGDQIRIWVNDKVVKEIIYLTSESQGLDLPLEPGFNKVDFEALNQGTSGPNTAEFKVYDEDGGLISSNRWDLATGFKATIILVKE